MSDPFVHLRVASGYSLQYGASHPSDLVAQASEHGMDTLALTDRDGLYGAIRFAKACLRYGIAPVLGVDLAVDTATRPPVRSSTPARGGEIRDPRLPRVVVMATSRRGWAQLNRLVTGVHLSGERGTPVTTPEQLIDQLTDSEMVIQLGSDSPFGLAVAAERRGAAETQLQRWINALGPSRVVVALTDHLLAGRGINTTAQAGRMLSLADQFGVGAVLTNQVRMAQRHQATTIDVLDAARRLVPLDLRNIDRRNAEGFLKPGKEMIEVAELVARAGGRTRQGAERLIADTRTLGVRCALDPKADIGLGEIHLPEFEVLGTTTAEAMGVLRSRCEAGIASRYPVRTDQVNRRLDDELEVIAQLGFASYFLTVADVVDLVREMGIRCAARGSGAGSLVNHLLGISGVDPLRHGLVMERFMSPLRQALPDIDLDVESARRTEVYEKILQVFGGERVACVAMVETYRVRHAVRDVGAALSLPPIEIDAIATAFPHIRAKDARAALRDLPELRAAGLAESRLDVLFSLVESLDGLPRHLALHPCGVLLSDSTLGDRTPIEASFGGFPMSQFDKDDVEDIGLLKLDVLGIRMQSAMAYCLDEIERTEGHRPDIDGLAPYDDPGTYEMIAHAATLGCFQIESPGQRELIGKFGPASFDDIIIDISLFRPGPVKSDMVMPFLNTRHGWAKPNYLHRDLEPVLAQTGGVVVFHEQVIQMIAVLTGCTLAQADEARRALGDQAGQRDVYEWFAPTLRGRGYRDDVIEESWRVLAGFASFGFCKAHAAAFALPTYQSAWLKRYYPAHFIAGVLTHDPGMYPQRLVLEEARRMDITILGLDVNRSGVDYRVECLHSDADSSQHEQPQEGVHVTRPVSALGPDAPLLDDQGLPVDSEHAIRLALSQVKGISTLEVQRIIAGQPYSSLNDFWVRAHIEAPVVERLILAGAFDRLYGIGRAAPVHRRGRLTRRDLLLALADLKRVAMAEARTAARARGLRRASLASVARQAGSVGSANDAVSTDPRDRARRQARGEVVPSRARAPLSGGMQLALDFTVDPNTGHEGQPDPAQGWDHPGWDHTGWDHTGWDHSAWGDAESADTDSGVVPTVGDPGDVPATGLGEMVDTERLAAELEILGLDASSHIIDFHRRFLTALGITWSHQLLQRRSHADLLVAGVKVATQTPAVRSGRRVVFVTLDDGTGPVDATFFEDAQGPYARTVFGSWLLVVRGELRRTGPRGVSLRATGAWDLALLHDLWTSRMTHGDSPDVAMAAVVAEINTIPELLAAPATAPRITDDPSLPDSPLPDSQAHTRAGGMGQRRVLVHASGFQQSPYADIKPAGAAADSAPRKLWHSSPGSSGR